MRMRTQPFVAVLWASLALPAAAQTVSITLDDGPSVQETPLLTSGERNTAILRHLGTATSRRCSS